MYDIIPIDKVHPAEDNVRRRLGDTRDLAASLASVGIVEPLLVTPTDDGGYTVVVGHRRLAAAQAAGLKEVPCTIRTLTDLERVEIMVAENLARAGLTVIEEATGYFRMAEFGLTAKDLAKRLGRSAAHVKARLALLELPKAVKAKLDAGSLTVGDGTALLALKDHPDVIAGLLDDDGDPWDRRDLERAVVREVARIEADAKAARPSRAGGGRRADRRAMGPLQQPTRPAGRSRHRLRRPRRQARPPRQGAVPRRARHRRGDVVLLCTEPARHRTSGESKAKAPEDAAPTRSETRAAERAEARQRRARDAERRAFTVGLLSRRLPRADAQALVADQQIAAASPTLTKAACALLGIDTDDADPTVVLRQFADRSAAQRDRACLALALAAGDEAAGYDPHGHGRLAGTHLAFLASYGWPPADDAPVAAEEPEVAVDQVDEPAA